MTKIQIKTIINHYDSIKQYIVQRAKDLYKKGKFKDKNVFGFSINMPLTDSSSEYVKLQKDVYHLTFMFMTYKNKNDSIQIINDYVCHWIYNKNEVQFIIDFKNEILDFYDWYCRSIVNLDNPNIKGFVTCNDELRLDILRHFGLLDTYYVVFNHNYPDHDNVQLPSKLKQFMLNFKAYKQLYKVSGL